MPEIKVYQSPTDMSQYRIIQQGDRETVLESLQRAGISVLNPCGGNGTCGKCRFLLLAGKTSITEEERKLLSVQQLQKGERLMCRAIFTENGAICLSGTKSDPKDEQIQSAGITALGSHSQDGCYQAAVDIGTTTIAMALVECSTGRVTASLTQNNSQRQFGADVLSRIKKANEGEAENLKRLIWKDITDGLDLLVKAPMQNRPDWMVISANTTMEHLLMGDSCAKLGEAPFQPFDISLRNRVLGEVHQGVPEKYADMRLTLLPGVSAFVGADIVSGMYDCELYEKNKPVLFLDLGTNGEMVLGTKSGFLATATAVGPAFEGGNITCGCPGVPGAVCSVSMMGQRMVTHTIGNKKPIGICGTGILELTYELYKTGIIDENGNLRGEYLKKGYPVTEMEHGEWIVYTQSDIRQLQMAKAAVRSGIEILMKEMKLTASDVQKVYLAGGFGYKLNVYKAAGIGLIPKEWREKAVAAGNTSLQGAVRFLKEKDAAEYMEHMLAVTKEINLAAHPDFEKYYFKHMNFDA